ncbi:hypothetical protein GCM10022394_12320 [Zobellella aerophila]|uniref:Uncharacterized protein n=1 Tax=Zobellella aerophila TaxID=870480 RepID=A0ABP6VIJ1_9GAMM
MQQLAAEQADQGAGMGVVYLEEGQAGGIAHQLCPGRKGTFSGELGQHAWMSGVIKRKKAAEAASILS